MKGSKESSGEGSKAIQQACSDRSSSLGAYPWCDYGALHDLLPGLIVRVMLSLTFLIERRGIL